MPLPKESWFKVHEVLKIWKIRNKKIIQKPTNQGQTMKHNSTEEDRKETIQEALRTCSSEDNMGKTCPLRVQKPLQEYTEVQTKNHQKNSPVNKILVCSIREATHWVRIIYAHNIRTI
jgi:sucrose-6-phosphate hydrolase SacC (GH32 family)